MLRTGTEEPRSNMTSKSKHKKGKVLHGDAREIVYNVLKYFEEEKSLKRYLPYQLSTARTAMATGLSVNTITKIKKEGRLAEQTGSKIQTPSKGNRGLNNTRVPVDDSVLCAIRQIIASMYVRKEVPTVGKILAMAKKDGIYKGSKTTLRRILKEKLGFKFNNNCGQNQMVFIERDNMNNTLYHSMEIGKVPTAMSRKEDIRKWMQKQHIPYEDSWTKTELLMEIKKHEPEKTILVNELLIKKEKGHEVWVPQNDPSNNFEHEIMIEEVKHEKVKQEVVEAVVSITPDD